MGMEEEVKTATEDLQFEDEDRCLYSQSTRKTTAMKFPKFSGAEDKMEDYAKFAKDLIPESMTDIQEALKILSGMYGSITRLLKNKKGKLAKIGNYPNAASKTPNQIKTQLKWLISCEVLLKELFELAERSDEARNEVFNLSILQQVRNFFPEKIHAEFLGYRGSVKEILEQIYNEIARLHREKRIMENG